MNTSAMNDSFISKFHYLIVLFTTIAICKPATLSGNRAPSVSANATFNPQRQQDRFNSAPNPASPIANAAPTVFVFFKINGLSIDCL
jgi:hypothetical protein